MSYYFKTLNNNEAYDEKLQMSRKYIMAFFLKLTHNLLNIENFKKVFDYNLHHLSSYFEANLIFAFFRDHFYITNY